MRSPGGSLKDRNCSLGGEKAIICDPGAAQVVSCGYREDV